MNSCDTTVYRGRRWLASLGLLLATVAAPFPLRAADLALGLGATPDGAAPQFFDQRRAVGPINGAVEASDLVTRALATGSVNYRLVSIEASCLLGVGADFDTTRVNAAASASWDDVFTLHPGDPALDGQLGFINYSILIEGDLFARKDRATAPDVNPAAASYSVNLAFFAGLPVQEYFYRGQYVANNDHAIFGNPFNGDASGQKVIELDFYWGQPIRFLAGFSVGASLGAGPFLVPESSGASAFFSNTFRSLGLSNARDSLGNSVTDYYVTSTSGVDWSKPVSEPTGGGAWCLAIACLAARRRMK
jgi:hypothetical protein